MDSREVIAGVLLQHQPHQKADNTSRPGFRIWRDGCSGCDWLGMYTGTDYESFALHVADAVSAALNLTEQWGVVTDMGVQSDRPLTEERAKQLADRYEDMTARHRLAGPWKSEEVS